VIKVLDRLDQRRFIEVCQGSTFKRFELELADDIVDAEEERTGVSSLFVPFLKFTELVQRHLEGVIDTANLRPILNPIYVHNVWKEPVKGRPGKKRRKKKAIPYPSFKGEVILHDLKGLKIPFSTSRQEKFIIDYNEFIGSFNFSMDELTPEQQYGYEKCRLENADAFRFPWFRRVFNYNNNPESYFACGGRWYGH